MSSRAATGPAPACAAPAPVGAAVEPAAVDLPHRRFLIAVEAVLAVAGAAGAVQLLTGTVTPPDAALDPLPFETWTWPGLWLAATVAVPAGVAAYAVWARRPWATTAVLVSAATLGVELAVQIPFVGTSVLQAVFGGVALALAGTALDARRRRRAVSAEVIAGAPRT